MSFSVLYKDEHLILVRKPAGIPAQPDPSGQESLLSAVQRVFPKAGLVHRLDTPTGGTMVFGLNPAITAALNTSIQNHDCFQKEYLAVLAGKPQHEEGRLLDYLYHDKRQNKSFVTDGKRKGSKEAVLEYHLLDTAPNGYALVRIRLYTGRTHQIRVQFASRGFPLVGDGKYGSREKCPYIGLWAFKLEFLHPATHQLIGGSSIPDINVAPWCYFQDFLKKNT